jgi:hypothetical protein
VVAGGGRTKEQSDGLSHETVILLSFFLVIEEEDMDPVSWTYKHLFIRIFFKKSLFHENWCPSNNVHRDRASGFFTGPYFFPGMPIASTPGALKIG